MDIFGCLSKIGKQTTYWSGSLFKRNYSTRIKYKFREFCRLLSGLTGACIKPAEAVLDFLLLLHQGKRSGWFPPEGTIRLL